MFARVPLHFGTSEALTRFARPRAWPRCMAGDRRCGAAAAAAGLACVRACACVPVLEDEGWGIAVLLFGDVENLAMNAVKEAEIPVSRVGGTG